MRILMAGASGFLGTRLTQHLAAAGHDVRRLVRREPAGADEIRWDPAAGRVDPDAVAAADAVVNLSGANVGGRRWTDAYKQELRDSRIDATTTLARAISAATDRPAVLLNSSAVGYYGDAGDKPLDETAPPGTGFLADLCRDWEAAAEQAEEGVRVVRMRTGLPLARDGGMLKPLLTVFNLGGGGKLGSGEQYLSWISLPDWLAAVSFLLDHDLVGPVNLTGPDPVTNAEFTRALGHALHRPTLLPVPKIGLKAVLGEFGDEATASQRARPAALTAAGFTFRHRTVAEALDWAIHHNG